MELPVVRGQRDSRWASEKLGFSTTDTIGGYGCLITDISIMVDAFDYPKNQATPSDVNAWLKKNNGYVSQDLVVWGAVPKITGSIIPEGTTAGNLTELSNYLLRGNRLAICEVRLNGYMHFVLAYKSYGGTQVWCHDPWTNTQKLLSAFGGVKAAHLYAKVMPAVVVDVPVVVPVVITHPPVAQPVPVPDLPPVVVKPVIIPVVTPEPVIITKPINKENNMDSLKGYRTYISLVFAFVASVLPNFGVDKTISEPLVALCLAAAAYFRSVV